MVALLLLGLGLGLLSAAEGQRKALVLEVVDVIGPASSDLIERTLERAEAQQAALVILRMDTPGGLDTSMRSIIKHIIASEVPVVSYVAPSGARAASAGTYILYASHVAAMAPGTNLGAATPVQLGGESSQPEPARDTPNSQEGETEKSSAPPQPNGAMERKAVNDATAYIRGLAQMRGRNVEWAEKAVREAASLPAQEALTAGVIDLIATDIPDLLKQLDGRVVSIHGREITLDTQGLGVERVLPDWRSQLLSIISNPNVAYILMLIGIYGLIYEFANPGAILPGTVGAICLILALYAFHVLPVNYAGIGLILLGLALMVAEAFVPSFGALGIGGIAAFIIGSIILMDTDAPGFGIDLPLILGFAIVSALLLITVASMAIRSFRRPVVSGAEELIGAGGLVIQEFEGTGQVRVHGEVWRAHTTTPLQEGQKITVTGRDGLTLLVTPEIQEHKEK